MNRSKLFNLSLYIGLLAVLFITAYPFFITYYFSSDMANYLFSLFYIIIFLNFIGNNKEYDCKSKADWIFKDFHSIVVATVVSILFSVILARSGFRIFNIFLIILCGLTLSYLTLVLLKRRILLILFWINFYLWLGLLAFSQLPTVQIDLISKYNPYGGLLVLIFK